MFKVANKRFRVEGWLARGSSRSSCSGYSGIGEMFDEVFDDEFLALGTLVCVPALAL
jgi:hypothetical protein